MISKIMNVPLSLHFRARLGAVRRGPATASWRTAHPLGDPFLYSLPTRHFIACSSAVLSKVCSFIVISARSSSECRNGE